MDKMKRIWSGIVGLVMAVILFMALTGGLDNKAAEISGNSRMLRGNDTGPTIADNSIEVTEQPSVSSTNSVSTESITDTAVVEQPETGDSTSFDEMFNSMTSSPDEEEEPWWYEDREYATYDDATNREINVRLHWAAEDLGEFQMTLLEDGEVVADSGVCTFETDGMWSFLTYNGKEASFYFDGGEDGMRDLHLLLGDVGEEDEIVLTDLKWLQQNAG